MTAAVMSVVRVEGVVSVVRMVGMVGVVSVISVVSVVDVAVSVMDVVVTDVSVVVVVVAVVTDVVVAVVVVVVDVTVVDVGVVVGVVTWHASKSPEANASSIRLTKSAPCSQSSPVDLSPNTPYRKTRTPVQLNSTSAPSGPANSFAAALSSAAITVQSA